MGEATAIAWTDHTFNPWWGCERVSPGCLNCYAEAFAKRTGNVVWGKKADRRRFADKHWNEPLKWDRAAAAAGRNARVFCASMADVFEDRDDHIDDRRRLFELIVSTPHLTWQLLTKRPENVSRLVPGHWLNPAILQHAPVSSPLTALRGRTSTGHPCWPSNVWIGCTVEDQQRANERVPHLLALPAPVRFLSCEPLLGPVLLAPWLHEGIGWVIVGGESGPRHRPFDLEDARVLRDECEEAGIPFFFKQVGGRTPTAGGHLLDGREWHEFPT